MPSEREEVRAFDILLCQSKYKELKDEYTRKMHCTPDESKKILTVVEETIERLGSYIKRSLEDGSDALDSVEWLKEIESTKQKLDGLNSLLKCKEIISKHNRMFTDFLSESPDIYSNNSRAKMNLNSAKNKFNSLEKWTIWIKELFILNRICCSLLKKGKMDLDKGNAQLNEVKSKCHTIQVKSLDIELKLATADYYVQNVIQKLAGEDKIITDLKSELHRVIDRFNGLKKNLNEVKELELVYLNVKSEYIATKQQLSSWGNNIITIVIVLFLIGICVGLFQFLYSNENIKTTGSVPAAPLPFTHNVSAHVALVAHGEYSEKETVLLLNDQRSLSSSAVQYVGDVALLKNGLLIKHAGLYQVYYSINIRPKDYETCDDFENKPFKSYVFRKNTQDHSIENKLLMNSHMCCTCTFSEETKYSSGVFELNVGDLLQVIWSSKKIPLYFHEQSSFLGLSMR